MTGSRPGRAACSRGRPASQVSTYSRPHHGDFVRSSRRTATEPHRRHPVRRPDPRRRHRDVAAAGRHHRLARHQRVALDQAVRPEFPVDRRMGSARRRVRRARADLRHHRDLADRAHHRRAGQLRHCPVSYRAVARVAAPSARYRHRAARRRAFHRLRHVGAARVCADLRRILPEAAVGHPWPGAGDWQAVPGRAARYRPAVCRRHPGHHDHSVHRLGDARRV